MVEIELTDEQRLVTINVFEAQNIRVVDYSSALEWKSAIDALAGDWKWRIVQRAGLDGLNVPDRSTVIRFTDKQVRVIAIQLMSALRTGLMGHVVWNVIDVIERIRLVAPDAVAVCV